MFVEWMQNRAKIEEMFSGHAHATAILFQTMRLGLGHLRVDSREDPEVAWFNYHPIHFCTGDPDSPAAVELLNSIPVYNVIILPNEEWVSLIKEQYGDDLKIQQRTKFNPDSLNLSEIRNLKNNKPGGFELEAINEQNLLHVKADVCRFIDLHFGSVDGLLQHGIGFCLVGEEEIASIAYSAFPFINEFEIQVDTMVAYRRRGFATVVAAALIEYALESNLVPHWDAANEASIQLAEQLGYSDPDNWEAYYRKR